MHTVVAMAGQEIELDAVALIGPSTDAPECGVTNKQQLPAQHHQAVVCVATHQPDGHDSQDDCSSSSAASEPAAPGAGAPRNHRHRHASSDVAPVKSHARGIRRSHSFSAGSSGGSAIRLAVGAGAGSAAEAVGGGRARSLTSAQPCRSCCHHQHQYQHPHHQHRHNHGATAGQRRGSPTPNSSYHSSSSSHVSAAAGRRAGGGGASSGQHCSHGLQPPYQHHHQRQQQQQLTGYIAADIKAGGRSWSPMQQAVPGVQSTQQHGGGAGGSGMVPRRVQMAEFVEVADIAKGFAHHWLQPHSGGVLHVFDGTHAAAAAAVNGVTVSRLLRRLPEAPGLHLWLVHAPTAPHRLRTQWVPVHLGAAASLQQELAASYLHADGSCGPRGSKQKVLLDLMCRGFAVQVRHRPRKPGAASVEADLLAKLALFDFPLNDANNGGCRPIELPSGWPVSCYPLVVQPMMQLYERLFGPRKLL